MPDVAALVLAAGKASRYRASGGREASKLVADYRGAPLIRWSVCAAMSSRAASVTVVTGHAHAEVEKALCRSDVRIAHNPDYAQGLSTSLRAGVEALPPDVAGVLVLLADMPEVSVKAIDALIEAFLAKPGALAAAPVFNGQRGNPVLIGCGLFDAVARLQGDEGARRLLAALPAERIATIEVDEAGVIKDLDRAQDF